MNYAQTTNGDAWDDATTDDLEEFEPETEGNVIPLRIEQPLPDETSDADQSLLDEVSAALADGEKKIRTEGGLSFQWAPEEYAGAGIDGAIKPGSAWKLHDSVVAPLIVAARGYETIHEDSWAEAAKRLSLPRRNTTQGRRMVEALGRGEILIMPWFTTEDLSAAAINLREPHPTTIQFRPARPELNDDGKELKYEFVVGQKTPIGVHPAYDQEWIQNAPVALIGEGLLKGDSAMTGFLLGEGVDPADLEWDGSQGGRAEARARLAEILDSIPPERRVVVLTIGGVYNYRNNSEWFSLSLNGREVWVGVDGDVSSNLNVWRATTELWEFLETKKKASTIRLIAPSVKADGEEKKVGIDDYLSRHGNWKGLVSMLAPTMPPRPASDDSEFAGQYRISEDGTTLQFCEPLKEDAFNPEMTTGGRWKDEYALGARIVSMLTLRTPTNDEVATGIVGAGADNDQAEAYCTVEVRWTEDDQIRSANISGPADILNYTPDQWARHKAHIPGSVLACEHWPPPKKIGEDWLRAIKAHRKDERREQVRWDAMGWVPVGGNVPAFVIGNQVIGEEDLGGVEVDCGITDAELAGASRFGLGTVDDRPFDDPDYCARVRHDIEEVLRTFILGGAWTDRRIGSTIVAAALRPALPMRPAFSLYFCGPPGRGKSMSAALTMGFWSASPGAFTSSSLPGSAKDTAAAMELSMARAPIWVIDDLAPSSARQQAEQEQEKIGNAIRNTFNGSAKRRSDANMGSRKVHLPRALLIVTAENEPQVASVRQRCVSIEIGYGALSKTTEPTNRVKLLCEQDGAPARVTQALVRFLRSQAKADPSGWAGLYQTTEQMRRSARDAAATWMRHNSNGDGDVTRHSEMAGDINVSLSWLYRLADAVDVNEELLALLRPNQMAADVCSLVMQGHKSAKESTPGRALLEALQSSLFKKRCHLLDATDPATAPAGPVIAPRLGWEIGTEGRATPKGDTIGYLYTDSKTGTQYVYLEQKAAFSVAQREFPNLVPHGQSGRSSWGSVVGEGLAENHLLRKEGEKTLNTARLREGDVQMSGVPVLLSVLLSGGDRPDGEKAES